MSRISKTRPAAARALPVPALDYEAYYTAEVVQLRPARAERNLSALELMYSYYDA